MLRPALCLAAGAALLTASGCAGTVEMLGAALAYRNAPLAESQQHLDLAYRTDPHAHPDKHKLDVFAPSPGERPRPVLVFVHGGGWTHGDRAMGGLGIQPMRNLGRFYAERGWVVVVPSYRLQPEFLWRDQVDDIASVVAWVRREVGRFGGDPERIHLGGHSAGAWLAAWVGLNGEALATHGETRDALCSLLLVSGASYDLDDQRTWELGVSRDYFEPLFGRDGEGWERTVSIRWHLDLPAPPALLLTAGGEPAKFQRQNDLLFAALEEAGAEAKREVLPGQDHQRIAVGLSRAEDPASEEALAFLRERSCASSLR